MRPFRSIILAASLLAWIGAAQARDDLDDVTMRVMEDIVKEDKGRGVRVIELPIPPAKARELQERSRERSQQSQARDKAQKKEGRNERKSESERHLSERQGAERKDHREDERNSRHDDHHDERDAASDDRNSSMDESSDDRTSVVQDHSGESDGSDVRTDDSTGDTSGGNTESPAASDTHDQESVEHN